MEHGIRLILGDESLTLWEKTCEAQPSLFPHVVYVATNNMGRGWININFETADEADAAAKVCVEIALPKSKKMVRTARTRWNKAKTLFISFDSLPTNLPCKVIGEELSKGFVAYGEIQQLKLQQFHLMPNLCTGKAIAVINPFPEVEEDLSRIPCAAEFHFEDGGQSAAFQVTLERAPPICNHCGSLGHKEHACPVKEGLMENDYYEEAMEEDN